MHNSAAFIDLNSFFASVEQQERPALRGRPLIVVPVMADSTCAIAVSYEARAFGIKTGTGVRVAKRMCPNLEIIEARHEIYTDYHNGIVDALNTHFVQVKPLSVDEMACPIPSYYGTDEAQIRLMQTVKQSIYDRVGTCLRSSIGIGPNVFLSKVASSMQKPNGLTLLAEDVRPQLFQVPLNNLPGIGRKMHLRLRLNGIETVAQLWDAPRQELRRIWGSVIGERWWYMLRGSQIADYGTSYGGERKSVSHSHVLPPEFRTPVGARAIQHRLFSKALARLRSYDMAAGSVYLWARYKNARHEYWGWRLQSRKHLHANDDTTWLRVVRPLIESLPEGRSGFNPCQVGIAFGDLIKCQDQNLRLFDDVLRTARLCETVDALNQRFEAGVGLAGVYEHRHQAPERIAFGKLVERPLYQRKKPAPEPPLLLFEE